MKFAEYACPSASDSSRMTYSTPSMYLAAGSLLRQGLHEEVRPRAGRVQMLYGVRSPLSLKVFCFACEDERCAAPVCGRPLLQAMSLA